MSKIDKTVLRETAYVGAGTVLLSVLMQAVFLIIGKWDITVLFGNLLSGTATVLNFFLMGLSVQTAVNKEQKEAQTFMRFSLLLRSALVFAAALTGALIPSCFNLITVFLPLFFPRIAILFRPLFMKKEEREAALSQGVVSEGEETETGKENIENLDNENGEGV